MNSISFKNFRKFEEFPEFKFGDITILVGSNNAGKSTLAKAINFSLYFLKNLQREWDDSLKSLFSQETQKWFISLDEFGDYERIHNKNSHEPLELGLSFGQCEFITHKSRFNINILFKHIESTSLRLYVDTITLEDTELKIKYHFSERGCSVEYVDIYNTDIYIGENELEKQEYEDFLSEYRADYSIDAYITYLKQQIDVTPFDAQDAIYHIIEAYNKNSIFRRSRIEDVFNRDGYNSQIKSHYCNQHISKYKNILPKLVEEFFKNCGLSNQNVRPLSSRIMQSAKALEQAINQLEIKQLPLHFIDKSLVLTPAHPLHALIKHFFKISQDGILRPSKTPFHTIDKLTYNELFKMWLKDFEIAKDYELSILGGQVYILQILDFEDNWIDIADIGSGALRMIELFLFILTASTQSVLFIEEPEQNLHPRLQSQLAQLFLSAKENLGHKIIVETHSEYLVRRTQLEVALMNFANNQDAPLISPFIVYYFPKDEIPYDMKYTKSGRFENKFDEGFFDEATKWHIALLKLEKGIKL